MSACEECRKPLVQRQYGRKRVVCGKACYQKRLNRQRRQDRAWQAEKELADAENARYLREEFDPWRRGELKQETQPICSTEVKP